MICMCENLHFGRGRWGGFGWDTMRGGRMIKLLFPEKEKAHLFYIYPRKKKRGRWQGTDEKTAGACEVIVSVFSMSLKILL